MNIELLNEYRIIEWILNCWASINLLNKNRQIEKKNVNFYCKYIFRTGRKIKNWVILRYVISIRMNLSVSFFQMVSG